MNSLMRMAYGRSGSRLERVLVFGQHQETVADPRWLRLLLLAIWIGIPVLVSRFALPTATMQKMTVIDVSQLTVKPILTPEIPVTPKPVKPVVVPSPKPDVIPVHPAQKPLQQPPPKDFQRPSIIRPYVPTVPAAAPNIPRIARERMQVVTQTVAPQETRIRREAMPGAITSSTTTITRTRGAPAADAFTARELIVPLRRMPAAEDTKGAEGTLKPIRRSVHISGFEETTEGGAARIAAVPGRAQTPGTGDREETRSPGMVRGISLASLAICSSPQEEEDDIRAVLSVVGSRQDCKNEKGEFHFKASKRISSFNLMIVPSKGRKPANRCEELENAYRCLKTY